MTTRTHTGGKRRTVIYVLAAVLVVGLVGLAVGAWAQRGSDATSDSVGIDLEAFAKAWGSGDADQIRAFYTDDAVIEPLGHLVSTLHENPQTEFWDVSGPDLEREALEHKGATIEYGQAERQGNVVVATFRMTFPEGFPSVPPGTVLSGGDILQLRGDRIWRQFSDFEVYVNGELREL
jgi:hypothetical protein